MKDLGIARKFLGKDIEYGEDGQIKVHVASYLEDVLERHRLLDCNPVSTPMLNTEKLIPATHSDALADRAEYQQIVGEAMFAGLVARPDIMCAISKLSQFGTNPTSTHLQAAKHLLRYLKVSKLPTTRRLKNHMPSLTQIGRHQPQEIQDWISHQTQQWHNNLAHNTPTYTFVPRPLSVAY
jgi:hypothetical protein